MRNNYKTFTDAELSIKLNARDKNAYEEIYNRYYPLLTSYTNRMTKDCYAAEDIVQDLFMNLYAKMGEISLNGSLESYLYISVRNGFITWLRKNEKNIEYINSLKDYISQSHDTTDNRVRERELKQIIENEIAKLPPKMKAIFEMSRKEYLNHQQIARETGISRGTVTKQITNAIKILRSKLTSFLCLLAMMAILILHKLFN
jgi:RNA polymerase sigma-70 factor (ECF subfamily)